MHGVLAYEDHRKYFARFRCQSTDLNGLLDLAERIRHNCVRKSSSLETLRLIRTGIFSTLVLIVSIGCYSLPRVSLQEITLTGQAGLALCGSMILLVAANFLRRHHRHWCWQRSWHANEVAALQHVLNILHDYEDKVAHDQKWSPIDRARFRIQLARYELGNSGQRSSSPVAPPVETTPTLDWPPADPLDPKFGWADSAVAMDREAPIRQDVGHSSSKSAAGTTNRGIFTPMRTGRFVLRR